MGARNFLASSSCQQPIPERGPRGPPPGFGHGGIEWEIGQYLPPPQAYASSFLRMAVDLLLLFGVFCAVLAFFHLSEFALAFAFNRREAGFQCARGSVTSRWPGWRAAAGTGERMESGMP